MGLAPLLSLEGPQGSAKTTRARILGSLLDPRAAAIRSEPRDARDLFVAAANRLVLIFDNLSSIPGWLSDGLCRFSTGGAYATRQLYTDADEQLFEAKRPVILTGIEQISSVRQDLLDRSIVLDLKAFSDARRMTEKMVWAEFDRIRPRVLGALYGAVSAGLRNRGTVSLQDKPRMADFAEWVMACAEVLPFSGQRFLDQYLSNRRGAIGSSIEFDGISGTLLKFMERRREKDGTTTWTGNATQLLAEIRKFSGHTGITCGNWPATARALAGTLRRAAPHLAVLGLQLTQRRGGAQGERLWEVALRSETPVLAEPTRTVPG